MSQDKIDDLEEMKDTAVWVQTYISLITDSIELTLICFTIFFIYYQRNKRIND